MAIEETECPFCGEDPITLNEKMGILDGGSEQPHFFISKGRCPRCGQTVVKYYILDKSEGIR